MSDNDYVSQEELDDAIIEDTCHCQCCGASFVLGGNDYVLVEVKQIGGVAQLSLCMTCAGAVSKAYRDALSEMGICEHGVDDKHWCEDCNREHKEALARWEKEHPQ